MFSLTHHHLRSIRHLFLTLVAAYGILDGNSRLLGFGTFFLRTTAHGDFLQCCMILGNVLDTLGIHVKEPLRYSVIYTTKSLYHGRRVVAVTPQPRHWSITVNSGCSRHSGHVTAEWEGREGVAAACAASSRTDVQIDRCRVHRCPQWRVQAIWAAWCLVFRI